MASSFRLGISIFSTLAILNVSGLSESADVRVGGIHEETVRSILLPNFPNGKGTVVVDLRNETQAIVKNESIAAIQPEGLLGYKFVKISFGSVDAQELKDGDEIESKPPFEISELFDKANQVLNTSQGALEKSITGKINARKGTPGKPVNDTTPYQQATQRAAAVYEDADALKGNFFVRGFFKNRRYTDPAEITNYAISQLPGQQPVQRFVFDAKKLFKKSDEAKLRNQKMLKEVGQYLHSESFGLAVIMAGRVEAVIPAKLAIISFGNTSWRLSQ